MPSYIHLTFAVLMALAATVSAFAETPPADPQQQSYLSHYPPPDADHPSGHDTSTTVASTPGALLLWPKELLAQQTGEEQRAVANPVDQNSATEWRWRRTSVADYAGAMVGIAGTLYVEQEHGVPDAQWTSRNGFDERIRDALRLGTESGRHDAHTASDVLMGMLIGAPVIDSFATLGIRDSRWDALWQTEMMNLESFTVTALVSSLLQSVIIPRERPFVRNCQDGKCEDGQVNRSMPSGHAAFAFTGAGLVCTHHDYQSLYGSPSADRAACATALVLATADGFLRIMSDRHYASDVLAGTALGLFSGFVLPRWLYYYWPQKAQSQATEDERALVGQVDVSPMVYQDGGGLKVSMTF